MSGTLSVHINRDRLHHIDVAQSFETDDSFTIALENHGAPIHAHLHLDDELSEVASLGATNHYVEDGDIRNVTVTVRDGPASGRLKVVTGYGAETAYVDLSITESDEQSGSIPVDESLSKPQRRSSKPNLNEPTLLKNLPLVALGVVALFFVAGAGFVFDGIVALFGAFVVLVGLITAAYFLTR